MPTVAYGANTVDIYNDYKLKLSSQSVELIKLDFLKEMRLYIVGKIAEMYDYKNFTTADYYYINKGISNSIDDNLFSSQVRLKFLRPTSNLMYARAKMITDACFYQAYASQAGMSWEETINSIENADYQWNFTYVTNAVQSNTGNLALLGGVKNILGVSVSVISRQPNGVSASRITLSDSISTVISNEGMGKIAYESALAKALRLTAAFEGGGVTGNFDEQG